jgi:hypothetical protein
MPWKVITWKVEQALGTAVIQVFIPAHIEVFFVFPFKASNAGISR